MTTKKTKSILGRMFLGEHEYAVDKQRRVAIPSQWRGDSLEENRFFLFPGRDRSLQLVPSETFQAMIEKLRKVSFADARAATALATIGSMAAECVCDKQGRITMTKNLMDHAGIKGKALLLGALTTVQIWTPENWAKRKIDSETGLDVLQALQEKPDDVSDILNRTLGS